MHPKSLRTVLPFTAEVESNRRGNDSPLWSLARTMIVLAPAIIQAGKQHKSQAMKAMTMQLDDLPDKLTDVHFPELCTVIQHQRTVEVNSTR